MTMRALLDFFGFHKPVPPTLPDFTWSEIGRVVRGSAFDQTGTHAYALAKGAMANRREVAASWVGTHVYIQTYEVVCVSTKRCAADPDWMEEADCLEAYLEWERWHAKNRKVDA